MKKNKKEKCSIRELQVYLGISFGKQKPFSDFTQYLNIELQGPEYFSY